MSSPAALPLRTDAAPQLSCAQKHHAPPPPLAAGPARRPIPSSPPPLSSPDLPHQLDVDAVHGRDEFELQARDFGDPPLGVLHHDLPAVVVEVPEVAEIAADMDSIHVERELRLRMRLEIADEAAGLPQGKLRAGAGA